MNLKFQICNLIYWEETRKENLLLPNYFYYAVVSVDQTPTAT